MPRNWNHADLLEAAQRYYKEDWTKQQIADLLKIRSADVPELLHEARARGLVCIDILSMDRSGLAEKLKAKHSDFLQEVFIVEAGPVTTARQYDNLLRKLALVAADYFDRAWQEHPAKSALHVGLSGGESLLAFTTAVSERERKNVYAHSLGIVGYGRMHDCAIHILPLVNASMLWLRCGRIAGQLEYGTAEPFPQMEPGPNARERAKAEIERIEKLKPIRDVVQAMSNVEIAFAGLGTVKPPKDSTPALRNRVTMTELLQSVVTPDQLASEGAAADFAYNIIDSSGRSKEKWRFFITAGHYSEHPGIAFYQNMVKVGKKVVTIAGPHKVEAIRAALAAKAFNVLISDSHSVSQIV